VHGTGGDLSCPALGNSVAFSEQGSGRIRRLDGSLGVSVCVQVYVAKKLDDGKFYAIKKARQQFKGTGDRRAPRARSFFIPYYSMPSFH
jgi:hypothetical protein